MVACPGFTRFNDRLSTIGAMSEVRFFLFFFVRRIRVYVQNIFTLMVVNLLSTTALTIMLSTDRNDV